jgi:hypothetical protein
VRLSVCVSLAALVGCAAGVLTVHPFHGRTVSRTAAAAPAPAGPGFAEPGLRAIGLPSADAGLGPDAPPAAVSRPGLRRAGVAGVTGAASAASFAPPVGSPAAATVAAAAATTVPDVERDLAGGVTFAVEAPATADAAPPDYSAAPVIIGPPLQIDAVRLSSLSSYSAAITWTTSDAAIGRVAYGLAVPALWTPADGPSSEHEVELTGLEPGRSYRLTIESGTDDGRATTSDFVLTTPARAVSLPRGSVSGGSLLVDGHAIFPTIVWAQCSDGYADNLAVGINVFMGNGCGNGGDQVTHLGGRALSVGTLDDDAAGLVGRYLPDEWDTHLPGDFSAADMLRVTRTARGPEPTFLTLTNHFYSLAEPLPQGRGMYPALAGGADVLGFDLYPLQNWCRLDSFGDVFDSQRQLVSLGAGKPTFQWIEARRMDCSDPALDPTPDTVRAEVWLSVAGGAHGVGYFPNNWSPAVGGAIARANQELEALAPALLAPATAASVAGGPVRVGARVRNGAVYVIAVNPSRSPATATIAVPEVGDRTLTAFDGTRTLDAVGGSFEDSFAPLEAHVYVARPSLP